jgi:16S rRNA processing protein RimM
LIFAGNNLSQKSQDPASDDLVRVGIVTKAHGIKGEVKVHPDFGLPDDFNNYKDLILIDPKSENRQVFRVGRCRPQDRLVILQFEELSDRTSAEGLCGHEVWIDRSLLPKLAEGELYWHDLIGLQAETEGGRRLGRVETMLATAGHDILVVRGGGREYLIPFDKEFIKTSDLEDGILIITEMPGLFEIND